MTTSTLTTATITGPDLSGIGYSPPDAASNVTLTSRIVLFDATGKNSQTRIVMNIASPTVTWSASDPLPGGFIPAQARVETLEQRYTWMLTVRRSTNGQANVDVTVFFRRPIVANPQDEQVYVASGRGLQFTVQYGGLTKPFAKKGGFLFDTSYAHWYRILDITNDTGTQFTVLVDGQRPQSETIAPTGSNEFGAVFMRGVVDVFPIETNKPCTDTGNYQPGESIHRDARPRDFTLIEVMVVLAADLGDDVDVRDHLHDDGTFVTKQKGVGENDQSARILTTVLKTDLQARTMRLVVPFQPNSTLALPIDALRRGYFYYSENDPLNDQDDVLQFTIDLSKLPSTNPQHNGQLFALATNLPLPWQSGVAYPAGAMVRPTTQFGGTGYVYQNADGGDAQ